MKTGDRVCWTLKDGSTGNGTVVLTIDASAEHVLVAVDPLLPDPNRKLAQASLEFHPVICCTSTWLTLESESPVAPAPVTAEVPEVDPRQTTLPLEAKDPDPVQSPEPVLDDPELKP